MLFVSNVYYLRGSSKMPDAASAVSAKPDQYPSPGGVRKKMPMGSSSTQQQNANQLAKIGPSELELLLRVVFCPSSQPVLIVDDERRCLDASFGAGTLLGLSREQIVARRIDDFAVPGCQPEMERLWPAF
jgi:PAS domain-containing protein